jgi:outer membrane protein TolC
VGQPLPQDFIDNVSVPGIPKDVKEVITTSLETRYEIKIADEQIKLTTAEVNLAKASYLPDVNLDWTRYLRLKGGFMSDLDWSLLLSISLPLDNGGRYAKVQETYSKLRQANLEKERIVKNIQNEVEKAYKDLQTVQSDIDAREKGLSAAKETADIVQEEYKVGTATNVEVLFTKNSFEQAKLSLEKSKVELKLAYLRLKFAMGMLSKEF